jgi:hypothetical protein
MRTGFRETIGYLSRGENSKVSRAGRLDCFKGENRADA